MIKLSPFVRQYAIVITVNLSMLSAGLGISWPSPVLVKLRNETDPVLKTAVTEQEGSWIVSIGFCSALVSNFLAAYLLDRIGRKYCFLLGAFPRIISFTMLAFATEVWMILVGRLLNGMADSFTFGVIPIYASEIASKEIRGALGSLLQIFASIGIVMMLSIGPFMDYFSLNIIVLGIVTGIAIPLIFLPDSPYFLHRQGKKEEALKVLTFLRGSKAKANEEIKEYESNQVEEKVKLSEIIKSKVVLKAMGIAAFINMGYQLTGFNCVSFYLQTILVSTKTSVSSEIASVIIGFIQLFASVCTIFVIDRFGRKPILGTSLVGMALGLIGLGSFFKIQENGDEISGFLNYLPLISLILIVFCMSAGLGSLIWPLMSEIFDGKARAIGLHLGMVSAVIFMFLTNLFFQQIIELIGTAATYWLFSVNTLVLCLFILFCVPETKGKSFAEIQAALGGKSVVKSTIDLEGKF